MFLKLSNDSLGEVHFVALFLQLLDTELAISIVKKKTPKNEAKTKTKKNFPNNFLALKNCTWKGKFQDLLFLKEARVFLQWTLLFFLNEFHLEVQKSRNKCLNQ